MWPRLAEAMAIPWRAFEAMHWQMGEREVAERAAGRFGQEPRAS